jgi:hypothetical protein
MKGALKECSYWTRGRFLGVAGVLFVLQAGLIFLCGDRSQPQPPLSPRSVRFRDLGASVSEDQLMRQYFVGNPAVFPLPNPHGFSGRAWLDQKPLEYQSESPLEPPDWLKLDTDRLANNIPLLPPGFQPVLLDLAEQQARHHEPLPHFLAPEMIATQSVFRLEGGLNNRFLGAPPALKSWPSPLLLTNSAVQIAVSPAGEVVVARLDARSGWDDADADALAKARALRFRPAPSAGTRWGEAVFQWQTIEAAGARPLK